jgi:hypothetical protein
MDEKERDESEPLFLRCMPLLWLYLAEGSIHDEP